MSNFFSFICLKNCDGGQIALMVLIIVLVVCSVLVLVILVSACLCGRGNESERGQKIIQAVIKSDTKSTYT